MRAAIPLFALVLGAGSATAAPASKVLIDSFSPELVGNVLPARSMVGDYAMSLDLIFDTYPTTEMHITEHRKAAMTMTLTPAGTVRACVGMVERHSTSGQWSYKPAAQREPTRTRESTRLTGLAGTWRTVDGVAEIELDTVAWNTCDLATSTKVTPATAQLRCVGAIANPKITVAMLLCEVAESHQLLGLGLPLTPESRKKPAARMEPTPRGKQVILGAPGLVVTAVQSRGPVAAYTFKGDAVNLVENDYIPKPKPRPYKASP